MNGMPELPEVETVVRGLRASLPGRRILGVTLGKTDFIDDPAALSRDLPGCRIAAVERHGKFIAIRLLRDAGRDGVSCLLVHLGMTGRLVTHRPGDPVLPHTHAFLHLDDGRELRYTDPRRFGRIALAPDGAASVLDALGKEPLEITRGEFAALIGSRRGRVKALLLNQSVLRGMGNIYTDESLWHAKIHPMRRADRLKLLQLGALHRAIQRVLREAIRLGGSSISDYVDSEGKRGWFQIRHRVYGREGKRCFRCRAKIRRIIVAGRSSHFCPQCQPPPRGARGSQPGRESRSSSRPRRPGPRRSRKGEE